MSHYIHFTEEQKTQARQTDLHELLSRQGEKLKKAGSEYEWLDGTQKVTIRGNLWYHQYEQVGGDAVDFVRKFYNKSYPDAVEFLLGGGYSTLSQSPPAAKPPKSFELPKRNDSMRRVYAYLLHRRGIDPDVLSAFVHRGLIYESTPYHNAVFVGYDEKGTAVHAHKRGTGSESTYKGNAEGCDPRYSFHWTGKSNRAYLFEAPIDLLSFISMNKDGWRDHSYAAACGVSDQVLWQLLTDQPQIDTVFLCMDNDSGGHKAVDRIAPGLRERASKPRSSSRPTRIGTRIFCIPPKRRNLYVPCPCNERRSSMTGNPILLVVVAAVMFAVLGGVTLLSHVYSLNGIKSKTVGHGQHGTARWATKAEIRKIYKHIPFTPDRWRKQAAKGDMPNTTDGKPLPQGIVVGCTGNTTAMVDTGDVHVLMIGAAGVGKTAFWLYPCIEYACASGMSFLSTDTKGDVMRNYGNIAKQYGYQVSVIDLRNPTRSNGNNLLHLVNKYMDLYKEHPDTLVYKAKAEKYAKIISKTIILSGMDAASFGQNAYFYDAAEGLLTATILLIAEFCEPKKRHIVSVFKVIQELLAPSQKKGKNQFQSLMEMLPNDHKAKWFAGAALNTSDQSMASVMSTTLSRLNSFLDSELEQLLCFDTEIDAEKFCNEKSAIFVIMPEENPGATRS